MTTYIVSYISPNSSLIDSLQIHTNSTQTMSRHVAKTQARLSYKVTTSLTNKGGVVTLMSVDQKKA